MTAYNAITPVEYDASARLLKTLRSCPGGNRMEQVLWAASGSEAIQKALWVGQARDRTRELIVATRLGFLGKKGLAAAATGPYADSDPDPRWPGLKAHGAPELFAHFRRELALEDARRIAIDHTRQYAKRQITWFRHQLTPDLVLDSSSDLDLGAGEKLLTKIEA